MLKKIISERLISLRSEYSETQQDVADAVGIQRGAYGTYESGISLPPCDKLVMLAEHFDVTVSYLIGETNFRKAKNGSSQRNVDLHDIDKVVRLTMDELNDKSIPVRVGGIRIGKYERSALYDAFKNCLNICDMILK